MSAAHLEVVPGFNRADLAFLAESLEGVHGQGRIVEAAPLAAKFIRAMLAPLPPTILKLPISEETRAEIVRTSGVLPAIPVAIGGAGPDDRAFVLSPEEQRMVLKQRAHAERNAGDEEEPA